MPRPNSDANQFSDLFSPADCINIYGMSFDIQIINAFADNYIYLTAANGKTVVVDPGDADAVSDSLPAQTALEAILLTHSHADHIGGVRTLMRRFPSAKLYAAEECGFAAARICTEGAQIALLNGALNLATMETPGHTAGHISFYGSGVLFCGDVMFACGCGRLLGGTAAQMQNSLARFAALPADTKVYCGHEYTLANIAFARAADCENKALRERQKIAENLRARRLPTTPFTIAEELETNPFLRLDSPAVIAAARARNPAAADKTALFAALREWKDDF